MALWGSSDSVSVSGTVTITQNPDGVTGNVVGSSTSFNTTAKNGNYLIAGGNTYVVTTIANATFMTIKSGKNGINVVAQSGGTSYNIQQGPAYVPLSESSDHAADGIIQGNAELIYGVDTTEMNVSNGSITQYIITNAGSGYSANAAVTVSGNATSNATASATGRISSVNVNTAGSGYTTIPSVTIAAPSLIIFNGNTAVTSNATSGAFIAITSANSILQVNDKVTYAGNATSTPATLTDTRPYYVSFANTSGIKLSDNPGSANINFAKASGDNTTAGGATLRGETATAAAVLSGARTAGHAGWVRRVVGTGGRAGRVQEETLVAMGSITGDLEDTVMKDS